MSSEEESLDNVKKICRDLVCLAIDKQYDKDDFFTSMVMLINLRKSQDSEEDVFMLELMEREIRSEMRRGRNARRIL